MYNQCKNSVVGNSIDIKMECNDPSVEVRADIRVDEFNAKRLWGQILNCYDEPISNSLVKLVKVTCYNGKKMYEGIAHTTTDCEGFYQFDVCEEEGAFYKVIVNKAVVGPEKIVMTEGGNCNACSNRGYDACKRYEPIYQKYEKLDCNGRHDNNCHDNYHNCNRPNNCGHHNCGNHTDYCEQHNDQCGHHKNTCSCHEEQCNCSNDRKVNYATYTR